MALLKILTYPDDRLRQVAQPVTEWSSDLNTFTQDMLETMYDDQGVGLAATQVGVLKRIIVVDCGLEHPEPHILINPEIIEVNGLTTFAEGCLSVPGLRAEIDRPERIRIRYQVLDGTESELEADGLLAICIQHEIDHLDGKLYFDHLPALERKAFIQSYQNLRQGVVQ